MVGCFDPPDTSRSCRFLNVLQVCSSAWGLQPHHVMALRDEVEPIAEAL